MWVKHKLKSLYYLRQDEPTALDDYVNAVDGVFEWTEIDSYRVPGDSCITYILNVTSHRYIDGNYLHTQCDVTQIHRR